MSSRNIKGNNDLFFGEARRLCHGIKDNLTANQPQKCNQRFGLAWRAPKTTNTHFGACFLWLDRTSRSFFTFKLGSGDIKEKYPAPNLKKGLDQVFVRTTSHST